MRTTRNVRRTLAATFVIAACSVAAAPLHAQFGLSVTIGATSQVPPPPLPEYDQPEAPGDGYLWTPGYWAWDDQVADYYWVPGTWVMAPEPGLLWTPGYWAYDNGAYGFHDGYWGEHVGFYGGVNYGFGYFGTGYEGGYWQGDRFFYNTTINRINLSFVHNVYNRPMRPEWINHGPRYAFNGPGGYDVRPSRGEEMAFREHHTEPTGFQRNQQNFARQDRGQFSNFNHGAPPAAATPRPVENASGFRNGAAPAHGAPMGVPGYNRGIGINGNDRPGGNNGGVDSRGASDYRFNGDNRGTTPAVDPRTNGGGNNGSVRYNGAIPAQPAQQVNPGQGGNFQPGDGRFRPQPANPPRMSAPQDNSGNNRFNGAPPAQIQQQRQFQPTQQQAVPQRPVQPPPAQQQPVQQRPMQPPPAQQRPAQPQQVQRPIQAQPTQQRPAPAQSGGGGNKESKPEPANVRQSR